MKNIKTYGFGVVAQGFYAYLKANNEAERLHTVIIKNSKKERKKIKAIIETTNENTVRDKDMDVIVELISSSDEAYGIVVENLAIGKKVISANKKFIAENLEEIIKTERENNAIFLYEGAVCGSIPIIRVLNDFYANEPIHEVKGIFNGSSNYILSQLFNEKISYADALLDAQKLGFAEADPVADVGGFDALYKLVIATAHAYGVLVKPQDVLNIGIEAINKTDVEFAKNNQLKIKLIAKATLIDEKLSLSVFPTFVSKESDLFNVENEYNAVSITSENIGEQFYKGKGAGSLPTGSVVYADLKAIDKGYAYSYKKLDVFNYQLDDKGQVDVIISVPNPVDVKKLALQELSPIGNEGKQFLTKITIEELKNKKSIFQENNISIVAIEDEKLINELKNSSLQEGVITT